MLVLRAAVCLQVVPYNLYLAMFSPAIVNVLCFDPDRTEQHASEKQADAIKLTRTQNHGADQARGYAGKYPAVFDSVRVVCGICHLPQVLLNPLEREPDCF